MSVLQRPVELVVVARRCVYLNNYRIAGSKPYVSENLPQHSFMITLGDVLNAFKSEDLLTAIAEKSAAKVSA